MALTLLNFEFHHAIDPVKACDPRRLRQA